MIDIVDITNLTAGKVKATMLCVTYKQAVAMKAVGLAVYYFHHKLNYAYLVTVDGSLQSALYFVRADAE